MERYIALLRGINVGGHRKIKMDSLRESFSSGGFQNVQTYIQSGNVIFDSKTVDASRLSEEIESLIKKDFGHDVPTIIRTPGEISTILNRFPFEEKAGWKRYVSFLSGEPDTGSKKQIELLSTNIEMFSVKGSHLLSIVNKNTDEKPRFSNSFVETKTDLLSTTRNLGTVKSILDLSRR